MDVALAKSIYQYYNKVQYKWGRTCVGIAGVNLNPATARRPRWCQLTS